jgi:hypothetical protein
MPCWFRRELIGGLGLALFGFGVPFDCNAQLGRNESIAQTGQASPDGNGTFLSFSLPSLNNQGTLAFSASLQGTQGGGLDSEGMFVGGQGPIEVVARRGQPTPDGNGVFGQFQNGAAINDVGQTSFFSTLSFTQNGQSDNHGIYVGAPGNIAQIAREGQAVPSRANSWFVQFSNSSINNSGEVAFRANTYWQDGLYAANEMGIFRGSSDSLVTIAAKWDQLPGENTSFNSFFNLTPINESGQVAFWADVYHGQFQPLTEGVFIADRSNIYSVARTGQVSPDGNGRFNQFDRTFLAFGDSGKVGFLASLSNTAGGQSDDWGLFLGKELGPIQIVREGELAPGGNGAFNQFYSWGAANDSAQIVFGAELRDTSGGTLDNRGIYIGDETQVRQIVRTGTMAPNGNGVLSSLEVPVINNGGQTVFIAGLSQTAGGGSDVRALFASDGIDLIEIARTGDWLNGNRLTGIELSTIPVRGPLNDNGQVAYFANYSEPGSNSFAIVRWTPDLHWRSPSDGLWGDRTNWTLSLLPAAVHNVFIDPEFDLVVTGPAQNVQMQSLQLGGGQGTARLSLSGGHELAIANGVTIRENGQLSGFGTLAGDVTSAGKIFADKISINGSLVLESTSTFAVDLGGTGLHDFDQLTVLGDLTLDGQLLVDLVNGFNLGAGQTFEIIDVFGVSSGRFQVYDAALGQWVQLGEGGQIGVFGGQSLYITYLGGDGNDVSLFTTAVPEPSVAMFSFCLIGAAICRRWPRPVLQIANSGQE